MKDDFLTLLSTHAQRLYPQVIFELKAQGFSGARLPGNGKDFVLSKNPGHGCQRADATARSSPAALSHSRWGRDGVARANCPRGQLSLLIVHMLHFFLPVSHPGCGCTETVRWSARQLAPSRPWTWNRAGFRSNYMGDHPRQKPRGSCPGMGQRACREYGLTVIPSTLHYYQNCLCPKFFLGQKKFFLLVVCF